VMNAKRPAGDRLFEGERLCFATHGSFVLVLHTHAEPHDAEWTPYLETATEIAGSGKRMTTLVFTDGGAPTAEQRKPLIQLFKAIKAPIAVVSDTVAIRFVASSLAVVGLKIKGFSTYAWRTAFEHFEIHPDERLAVDRRLIELNKSGFGAKVAAWAKAMRSA
jgi:hypothetical protein